MSKVLLQYGNSNIGAVAVGANVPLGVVTLSNCLGCQPVIAMGTNANNVVYLNCSTFYKVSFVCYLTVAAAGTVTVNLVQVTNGMKSVLQTATVTAAGAGTVPIVFNQYVLVNSNPNTTTTIAFELAGDTALTGGSVSGYVTANV